MKTKPFLPGCNCTVYVQHGLVVTVPRRKAYVILWVEFHYSRSRARARLGYCLRGILWFLTFMEVEEISRCEIDTSRGFWVFLLRCGYA